MAADTANPRDGQPDIDDVPICRICRCEGSEEDPLFFPCQCTGSIKYIHQECLQTWLKHSKKKYCELCDYEYKFVAVYDDNMPKSLSIMDVITTVTSKIIRGVHGCTRMTIVAINWGFIFPIIARWTWQLYFEDWLFPWEKDNPGQRLLWDCVQGIFIGVGVFCLALGLLGLRDFIVANRLPIGDPFHAFDPDAAIDVRDEPQRGAQVVDLRHVNNAERNVPERNVPDHQPDLANRHVGPVEQDPNVGYWRFLDDDMLQDSGEDEDDEFASDDDQGSEISLDDILVRLQGEEPGPQIDGPPEGLDEELQALDEGLHALVDDFNLENLDRVLNVAANGGRNGLNGDNGELAPDDEPRDPADWQMNDEVPLEELFGLVGPIQNLYDNMIWIVLFNAFALFLFAFLPAKLGEIIRLFILDLPTDSLLMSVATGYTGIVVLSFLYLSLPSNGPLTIWSHILTFICVFVKVCALLVSEVVFCPLLCGWWLDICALELHNSSLKDQRKFFAESPWTSSFLHWFIGMLFMHGFASFIGVLREIMRKNTLWFFRDPNDPEFHPLKLMLEMSIPKYVRRILLINVMYGVLVVMGVWLPAKTICSYFPTVLPFKITFSHPFEMMMYHLAILILQDYCNVTKTCKVFLQSWIETVGRLTGLDEYLLPPSEQNNNVNNNNDANDEDIDKPKLFPLRLTTFMLIAWATLHVTIVVLLTLPVTIGRSMVSVGLAQIFDIIPSSHLHDLYAFALGCIALFALARLPMYASMNFFADWVKKCAELNIVGLGMKAIALGSIGFVLLPLGVGLLFQKLFIFPMKYPLLLSPLQNIWQDWGVGVMLLKIIIDLELVMRAERFKEKLRAAINDWPAFYQILWPAMVFTSLTMLLLALPFAIFRSQFLTMYCGAQLAAKMYRWFYPTIFFAMVATSIVSQLRVGLEKLWGMVREEKYLVGKRLVNIDKSQTS